jgi:hypothetical protein
MKNGDLTHVFEWDRDKSRDIFQGRGPDRTEAEGGDEDDKTHSVPNWLELYQFHFIYSRFVYVDRYFFKYNRRIRKND